MAEHALTLTRRYDGYFIASFAGVPEATACGRDSEEAIEEAAKALRKAVQERGDAIGDAAGSLRLEQGQPA